MSPLKVNVMPLLCINSFTNDGSSPPPMHGNPNMGPVLELAVVSFGSVEHENTPVANRSVEDPSEFKNNRLGLTSGRKKLPPDDTCPISMMSSCPAMKLLFKSVGVRKKKSAPLYQIPLTWMGAS